ncbi:tautomerase family protein [Aureibacillus halotolerans]|uniref:Tautomerase-like protein n=1 Tax=Aureibacillus halotolerans TaxID=1508390 RepID=A0A4R6UDG0_9BACI|nr:tautomerase family protein [Aureibacillus halotolerans]TDQ42825.1 tautomerase-like protein [Aureibacillus halotolerans]
MAQVKVYGNHTELRKVRDELSRIIHESICEVFAYPKAKKFHRFIGLNEDDFIYNDRSSSYTIIEILLFEGRTVEAKKTLIRLLFRRIHEELQISPHDIEMTLIETPKENWGIRGVPGDELVLPYKVDV